jgi:hypothetical protein
MMPHPPFMKYHHNTGFVGNNHLTPPGFMMPHPPGMMMNHHHLPHGGLMRPPPPSPQMMMPAPGMHHRHHRHPSRPIPFGRVLAENQNLRPEQGGVGVPVGNDDDNQDHHHQQQQDDNNIEDNVVTPHRDNAVNPRRVSFSPFVPAPLIVEESDGE